MRGIEGTEGQERAATSAMGGLGPRTSGSGQGHMCRELWVVPGPVPRLHDCKMSLILTVPFSLLPLHSPEGRGEIKGSGAPRK